MKLFALLGTLALAALGSGARLPQDDKVRYDNYSVYNIHLTDTLQRQSVLRLTEQRENFNLWSESNDELHLMVSPNAFKEFNQQTRHANVRATLLIPNVQELIDAENDANSRSNTFGWTRYNNLEQIEAWLDDILAYYPKVTKGFTIGKSYEGRNIRGLKISYRSGNPGVFIESNIHAREWITSATATWLINELLSSADEVVRNLAESHDWYIVPVLNVDGFVYSHEKDRLWRKTLRPSPTSSCFGVDANRNFNSHWMENGGASCTPCSETYAGPHPNSEPEIKAISKFIASIKNRLNVLLSFHSYGQLILSPYSHTQEEIPANYNDLLNVAKAYADAVNSLTYGTVYKYGSTASILYPASGITIDWAYNTQDIALSYTLEFRDTGHYGFLLPPAQILPNSEEALIGIMGLLSKSRYLGYLEPKYKL